MNKDNLVLYLFNELNISEYIEHNDNTNIIIYNFILYNIAGQIKYNKNKNIILYTTDDDILKYNKYNIYELIEIINIIHFGLNDMQSNEN